jgi:hypothetical protein
MLGAHGSVEKTLERLKEICIFQYMKKRVKTICQNCHICLRRNKVPKSIHPILGQTDTAMYPFRIVSIDTAGPLPPSPNDTGAPARHIVILIEHYTKFVVLAPLKDITARSICDFLREKVIGYFGLFELLISDSHPTYRSEQMQKFLASMNIKHRCTTPYNARANGQCENSVKTVKAIARAFCSQDQSNWSKYLPEIQLAINTGISASTKFSPYQMIFGRQPTTFLDLQLNRPNRTEYTRHEDYIVALVESLFLIRQIGTREMGKSREEQAKQYNKHVHELPELKTGDLTYVQDFTARSLDMKFRGPYVIIKMLYQSVFLLQELQERQMRRTVHARFLKPVKNTTVFLQRNPAFQKAVEILQLPNKLGNTNGNAFRESVRRDIPNVDRMPVVFNFSTPSRGINKTNSLVTYPIDPLNIQDRSKGQNSSINSELVSNREMVEERTIFCPLDNQGSNNSEQYHQEINNTSFSTPQSISDRQQGEIVSLGRGKRSRHPQGFYEDVDSDYSG